jgi:putative flippase GtrA
MSNRPLLISALRYGAAGVINTAIGLAVILGLQFGLHVQANLANAIGYGVGVCVSFALSRLFVFGAARPLRSAGPRYLVAVAFAFALNQAVLTLARHLLPAGGLYGVAAQIAGVGSYTAALFLFSHYWVFAAETGDAAQPRKVGWLEVLVVVGACFGAAAALMAPALAHGLTWGDSHVYNTAWVPEFSAALARGELTPRWLPEAFLGLGAPSFYFYPPLGFYVAAAIQAVAGGSLSVDQTTTWAGAVMLGLSGLSMYAWLRSRSGAAASVAGALVYMAAPYHLIVIYLRAAFAEASAFMILPLCLLALDRAAGRWSRVPWLGLAYAALICAHIGSALLTTVVAIGPYVAYLAWRASPNDRVTVLLRCLAGGALGLALAAFYLAPALLMQGATQMAVMWLGAPPADWTLFRPDHWPSRPLADALALSAWTAVGLSAVALLAARGRPVMAPVIALTAVVLLGFGLYAVPAVWSLPGLGPLLSTVQFPWRILLVTDFAAISALALAAARGRPAWALLALPFALLSVQGLHLNAGGFAYVVAPDAAPPWARRQEAMRIVPGEHLPPGLPWQGQDLPLGVEQAALKPVVQALDTAAAIGAIRQEPNGAVEVVVETPRPTRIVVRRFYFSSWRVRSLTSPPARLPAEPTGEYRLLSFVAPAGRATYRIEVVRTPVELAGNVISLLGLAVAAALFAFGRRRPSVEDLGALDGHAEHARVVG